MIDIFNDPYEPEYLRRKREGQPYCWLSDDDLAWLTDCGDHTAWLKLENRRMDACQI